MVFWVIRLSSDSPLEHYSATVIKIPKRRFHVSRPKMSNACTHSVFANPWRCLGRPYNMVALKGHRISQILDEGLVRKGFTNKPVT